MNGPAAFDGDEKRLLLIMLAREGQEAISRRGTSPEALEFSARCFDLAAKVARTAAPPDPTTEQEER